MAADIAIRGAGPVGCVLALLLHWQGRAVALQGRREESAGFRPVALSHASRLILERANAWPAATTPIRSIHVSQQSAFGRTRLEAADAGVPALGYVTGYGELQAALFAALEGAGIGIEADVATDCALTIHAEGTNEALPAKDYGQVAIVARVTARPAAGGTAWERFTPEGPLALLPLGDTYGLVWGMAPERAAALAAAPEAEFLRALGAAFGRRAGELVAADQRGQVPLALRRRASRVAERAAYVGNAAQTLHPVAGQGLNLGLRDAWDLAQVLQDAADPGAPEVLARYALLRRMDAAATVRVTDWLAAGLLGNDPLSRLARGIGLTALDICSPARRFFARRMIYGPSAMP